MMGEHDVPDKGAVLYPPHLVCLQVCHKPSIIGYMSLLENLSFGTKANTPESDPKRVRRIFKRVGVDEDHELMKQLDRDIKDAGESKRVSKNAESGESEPWHNHASGMEKKMINITRALVYNPDIMVLHRPMDEMDRSYQDLLMKLLRAFVNERGMEFQSQAAYRATTNVFMSCGDNRHRPRLDQLADEVCQLPGPESHEVKVYGREN